MRLRGDYHYLFVVLCLSAANAAVAEPIPKTFPLSLSTSQAAAAATDDGEQQQQQQQQQQAAAAAPSGDLLLPPTDQSQPPPLVVAVGLPTTETDFGPPIPQDPTLPPTDFGAYPGYPQPSDVPNLYDPKTRQKQNGHMDYYEQTRGECPDGEELYCCRWGQREVLSLGKITDGPIKCVIWLNWFPVWRFPQCIPEQQQCCAGGVDEFGNGIDCKKANKASNKKQKQGAAAYHDDQESSGGGPPGGGTSEPREPEKAPASQRVPVSAPGAQQFEKVDPLPPTRIPESSDPWNLFKLWPLKPFFQAPDWSYR